MASLLHSFHSEEEGAALHLLKSKTKEKIGVPPVNAKGVEPKELEELDGKKDAAGVLCKLSNNFEGEPKKKPSSTELPGSDWKTFVYDKDKGNTTLVFGENEIPTTKEMQVPKDGLEVGNNIMRVWYVLS
jgi:hypothetical protein